MLLLHPATRILQQPVRQLASEKSYKLRSGGFFNVILCLEEEAVAAGARVAVPQESLWASERLAAEPRIRSNRAQRKIFRPFLKIDLMDPNRTRPVRQQDLLGEGLLLG